MSAAVEKPQGIDPVWYAQSKLQRRDYDACINICTDLLQANPYDQAVWYLKTRALTLQSYVDDSEVEEEGLAEVLLDENATAQVPRPGTSLTRPLTSAQGGGPSAAVRPMTTSGRPLTGFARPGTGSRRPGTSAAGVEAAFAGGRPGTTRPVTSSGRFVRLGTASLVAEAGGPFINVDRLDLRKYAQRPQLARVLCDYLLYCHHDPKRALELAAHATAACQYQDWWWKARLGKAYYQLGLLRDAEKQLASSLAVQPWATTALELCKVYLRMDQPTTALDAYARAASSAPGEVALLLAQARVHDALNDSTRAVDLYKEVLHYDASCVEAMACLGAAHFYADQPEIGLRFFRRLLQMGAGGPQLWNNLALCCYYAGQYDMAASCFERALAAAADDDAVAADVWYNLAQMAIGIGDLALAAQQLGTAVALDPGHAEAHSNLGALHARAGRDDAAQHCYRTAQALAAHLYEPFYNGALVAMRRGDLQDAHRQVKAALAAFPEHTDSQELLRNLQAQFSSMF